MEALDWIALVISHMADAHEQTMRNCVRFSNAVRGKLRKQGLSQPLEG